MTKRPPTPTPTRAESARKGAFARIAAPEAAPPWTMLTVITTVIAAFVALVLGTVVAQAWFEGASFVTAAGWTIGGIGGALFIYQLRRHDRAALKLAAGTTPLPFIMFIALGFALAFDIIGLAITGVFAPSPELAGLPIQAMQPSDWLFAVLLMVLAQPALEELAFRGVALPSLRHALGGWGGVIACAGLSAAFHFLAYPPNTALDNAIIPLWYGIALPFLDALIIGAIRAATGSTRSALAAHAIFGVFAVVKLLIIA
jgi:membrane protease YdiL (CAAX protease family)